MSVLDHLLCDFIAFVINVPLPWFVMAMVGAFAVIAIASIYEAVSDYQARRTA